jgi:hypothetical protein
LYIGVLSYAVVVEANEQGLFRMEVQRDFFMGVQLTQKVIAELVEMLMRPIDEIAGLHD